MDPDGIMDPEAALTLALGGGFGAISLPVRPLQDDDDHPQACDVFDITEPFDPSTGWPAYVPPNVVKAWGSEPRTAWFPSNDHLYYYVPPGVFQHKSLPYPNGQSGRHVSKIGMIDYSDPRFFRPEKHERIFIIRMLGATMSDFRRLTGTRMMAVDVPDIDLGYAAAHNQVVLKFEAWVRDHRDISGDFREHGQVKKDVLYKLDRWYGLIEHWQFSPNCKYPLENSIQQIHQNPTFDACPECIMANQRCHGHKENPGHSCTNCLRFGRWCSKRIY